jgi:hypothetical protein
LAVQPATFTFGQSYYPSGYVAYDNYDAVVPQVLALSPTDQGTLIDFACCTSCRYNYRFNAKLTLGYQIDCRARTLTKLDDTCNDRRQALAFLNCWTESISSAPAANLGFAALVVAALFVW